MQPMEEKVYFWSQLPRNSLLWHVKQGKNIMVEKAWWQKKKAGLSHFYPYTENKKEGQVINIQKPLPVTYFLHLPPKDSIVFPSNATNWRQSVQTPEAFRKFSTKPPQILMAVLLRVFVTVSRKDCVKHTCILGIVITFKNACSTQNVSGKAKISMLIRKCSKTFRIKCNLKKLKALIHIDHIEQCLTYCQCLINTVNHVQPQESIEFLESEQYEDGWFSLLYMIL